jgi:4-amino-4-deoxy-L-arabinose transferase-like glycosyltransferase
MLIPALLVNLGIVPLYVEEPRRATVALEMLLRDNWLVPTINGEYYFLKPPFFNWILAGVYYLAGVPTEFMTRIPTVASLLLLGLVIFWSGKKYVSFSFGALSALLFVTVAGNLFFNSLLAEIDIFYSLVTYTGMICLFHFHQKRKYFLLFITVYILGAIGILTKGLPSLIFTGWSLIVFFLVNKDFKKLFSWQHIAGILLFLMITGGYFLFYNQYNDVSIYLKNLSVESGKRLSGDTFWDYLGHLFLYPLDTLMNLLPASLLLFFAGRKSFFKDIRTNMFMRFILLMLVVHFPVYWLPPGGRQRYIIMLYPFIIQVFAYFFLLYFEKENVIFRIFSIIITVAAAIAAVGCLYPLALENLELTPLLWIICLASFVLLLLIFLFQLKKPGYSIISMLFILVILRMVFNFTVLPLRATQGAAPANKLAAQQISNIVGEHEVCILYPTYLHMQTIYYFEKGRNEILPVCRDIGPGKFYIVEKNLLDQYSYRRDTGLLLANPLRPFSDPFSYDYNTLFSDIDYKIYLDFKLQKRKYLLLVPGIK